MTKYQISFQVKAIISVDVKAETLDDAYKLAKEKIDNKLFVSGIDYLDGNVVICGHDNIDLWEETNR